MTPWRTSRISVYLGAAILLGVMARTAYETYLQNGIVNAAVLVVWSMLFMLAGGALESVRHSEKKVEKESPVVLGWHSGTTLQMLRSALAEAPGHGAIVGNLPEGDETPVVVRVGGDEYDYVTLTHEPYPFPERIVIHGETVEDVKARLRKGGTGLP